MRLTATNLLATKVRDHNQIARGGTGRRKADSISVSFLAENGNIGGHANVQWHILQRHIVVIGVLLQCVDNVVDSSLMSLTSDHSVLGWRVVCKTLQLLSLLLQSFDLDAVS